MHTQGSGFIFSGIQMTQNDETHMPEATGPLPRPKNNIETSFLGNCPILGNMLIIIYYIGVGSPAVTHVY